MRNRLFLFLLIGMAALGSSAGGEPGMGESAREIPVIEDVDVVVAGGTLGAVSAAVEAARSGARVFLATPHAYLGEDVCATYRLWLEAEETPESAFERRLFAPPRPPIQVGRSLPFSYTTDLASAGGHVDTDPPGMLADGKSSAALNQSVQYNGDVTVVADLGEIVDIGRVHVLAFQRLASFEVASVGVSLSEDGASWGAEVTVANTSRMAGNFEDAPLPLTVETEGRARFVRVRVKKTEVAGRVLLGELVIEPKSEAPSSQSAAGTPPMPMQVKRTLEEELIGAGVTFLYGCFPTEVLRDGTEELAGIVIANRSGRQAVRAKCILDATPRAAVARMAEAAFHAGPEARREFRHVVLGGQPRLVEGAGCRPLPTPMQLQQEGWNTQSACPAYEYTLTLSMADNTFSSYALAEQMARDLTWAPDQLISAEQLFEVPPDAIRGRAQHTGAEVDVAALNLDVFRPADVDRLLVLSGCADMSREAAERLLRPLTLLRAGERVGRTLADLTARVTISEPVTVAGGTSTAPLPGTVHEVLNGARPVSEGLPRVASPDRTLPVLGRFDVVVVGGGTGGAPAGIAAARQGARTLLIEYQHSLGGVGTLGLIGSYYYGYLKGFTAELDAGVAALGGQKDMDATKWNVECKMEWYRRELRKAGATIWFGAIGCGTVMEGERTTGVVVATPDGRGVVLADVIIDATGNSDIAAAAGAECMTTGDDHLGVQGTGMPPRRPGANYTNTDYTITDDSDTVDFWRTLVAGREKYRDSFDLGTLVDSRERRRIMGDCIVSPLDIWNRRTYPDTIGVSRSNFDTHGFTVHSMFALDMPDKEEVFANTPYRALLPKGIEGILVIGLGMSAHRDAMPILRMQGDIQNQGYAAGCAAAMAAQEGLPPRKIDVKALQRHLVEKGNVPESVLTDTDSYPLPLAQVAAAVKTVTRDYEGLPAVLAQPDLSLPLLREACRAEEFESARLIYAHILGMLGDATGVEVLLRAVAGKDWDEGWSFTGGGQFGGSLSRLDSLLIALARTGDARALEPVLAKARLLDASSAFSHHRAIAIAAETLGGREAAPVLAELLRKPEMSGHVCLDVHTAKERAALADPNLDRDRSIRELLLARALYRCGDQEGLGESILRAYAKDLRGHFARHAQAVLRNDITAPAPGSELDMERWPAR